MTDSKPVILVADDVAERASTWVSRLKALPQVESRFEIREHTGADLVASIETLEERRRQAREGQGHEHWSDCEIDGARILLIDDDLLDLDMTQPPEGEELAYLARCYSKVGLIVAVNDRGEDPFDLTLRDSPDSYADVLVGSAQLDSIGLWDDTVEGFSPWYWAVLPDAAERYLRRVEAIVPDMNGPVLEALGINAEQIRGLPQSALAFLSPTGDVAATSVQQFVTQSFGGYRRRDQSPGPELEARVGAARLSKWLEFGVLPGQDFLVDAPHLVPRLPSLITGDVSDVRAWNGLCRRTSVPDALDAGRLGEASFARPDWLSRPAWWWSSISGLDVVEIRDPFAIRSTPFAFCEDLSAFTPIEQTRQFLCDFPESPFRRRFIADPNAFDSATQRRLQRVGYAPLNNLIG